MGDFNEPGLPEPQNQSSKSGQQLCVPRYQVVPKSESIRIVVSQKLHPRLCTDT